MVQTLKNIDQVNANIYLKIKSKINSSTKNKNFRSLDKQTSKHYSTFISNKAFIFDQTKLN